MSYQLTERPHKFSFSRNVIRYLVELSAPETPGAAVDFELYALPIDEAYDETTNPGELITSQTLYPNPDGKVYFYIEDFLNSYLEWELPALTTNDIVAVGKQIKKYYIRYRGISKANPTPPWATDAENIRIAIKGGIAKEKFDRNNFFINYLPDQKPFLTWLPADHFIGTDERRYLTYLHDNIGEPSDPAPATALKLKARVVYTDGQQDTATKDFPALSESLLFHCPAGLDQLGLFDLQPDKQIWYYTVSVEDTDGNVYAEGYKLYADYRKFYDVFSFIYHNSLGGIDTLRIRGDYDFEIQRESTDIEQATGGDFSGEELPTEVGIINISKFDKYTGDAGWMNSRSQQDACQDLLLSDNVFRKVFGRWLRVVNMQKTQPMPSKDETKFSFPLQWRYTFNNTNYTPFDKDFGAGANDGGAGPVYGTCQAPSDLTVEAGDDPGEFVLAWNEVAGAIGYEIQYKEDDDPDWTTTTSVTATKTITVPGAGQYLWRVRTQCDVNDYSGYTTGPGFEYAPTPAACDAPASLTVELISLDPPEATVRFSWPAISPVGEYVIEWREVGTTTWTSAAAVATNYTLPFLQADTLYEARVKSRCDMIGNYSGYTYSGSFIPSSMAGSCTPPSALSESTLHLGSSIAAMWQFFFTAGSGVGSYILQYRRVGYPDAWVEITGITVSPYNYPTLWSLASGYTWEWRMRSACTGGGYSNWVNGPNYTN